SFEVLDLAAGRLPAADVVTANLTGPLLERSAPLLLDAVRPDGTLILSGILAGERDAVALAFRAARCVWEREEDEWVAFAVKKSGQATGGGAVGVKTSENPGAQPPSSLFSPCRALPRRRSSPRARPPRRSRRAAASGRHATRRRSRRT